MSFVTTFMSYMKTRTDAPPDFHVHAAMTALAYAAGSNVRIPWYGGWAYPNLWIVILARSGMGKSVPLNMAESLIRQSGLGDGLLPESFSQEALANAVSAQPTGMFILQEFSSFTRTLEREYNSGSMQWLTSLYDVPDKTERIVQRKDEIKRIPIFKPCISILGASSPDWFADSFKEQQLRGGFLARFLFCPASVPGDYVDYPGPRDKELETGLACYLKDVSSVKGEFDTSQVKDQYDKWQRPVREGLKDCPPEFAGMRSRSGLMVWKAAMLFHLSRTTEDLVLTEKDMENAIKYVTHSQQLAERYLSEEVAGDSDEKDVLKLLGVIRRKGGRVSWSVAMMNTHLSAGKMDRAVRTLEQSDRVTLEPGPKKGWLCMPMHVPAEPYTNGNGAVEH